VTTSLIRSVLSSLYTITCYRNPVEDLHDSEALYLMFELLEDIIFKPNSVHRQSQRFVNNHVSY